MRGNNPSLVKTTVCGGFNSEGNNSLSLTLQNMLLAVAESSMTCSIAQLDWSSLHELTDLL